MTGQTVARNAEEDWKGEQKAIDPIVLGLPEHYDQKNPDRYPDIPGNTMFSVQALEFLRTVKPSARLAQVQVAVAELPFGSFNGFDLMRVVERSCTMPTIECQPSLPSRLIAHAATSARSILLADGKPNFLLYKENNGVHAVSICRVGVMSIRQEPHWEVELLNLTGHKALSARWSAESCQVLTVTKLF